jgi:hypothetical protein
MKSSSKKTGSILRNLLGVLLALNFIGISEAFAADSADHQCRVVLRHAQYSSGRSAGFAFSVDVSSDWLATHPGAKVYVRYNLNNEGWKDQEAEALNTLGEDFVRFNSFLVHNGYHSMSLNAVAYVEYQGRRLFDHNFEQGDIGSLALHRGNNWQVRNNNCR